MLTVNHIEATIIYIDWLDTTPIEGFNIADFTGRKFGKMSKLLFETLYTKANAQVIICCDGDAFEDGLRVYHELNGGRLYNKIKIVRLPVDKDVCDLRGQIDEYYYEIR